MMTAYSKRIFFTMKIDDNHIPYKKCKGSSDDNEMPESKV